MMPRQRTQSDATDRLNKGDWQLLQLIERRRKASSMPSIRELAAGLKCSITSIQWRLAKLVAAGMATRLERTARSIRITGRGRRALRTR